MNLSSHSPTTDETSVLLKGLTFCPNHKLDRSEAVKDLYLYTRKLLLRSMFKKEKLGSEGCRTFSERQALENLNSLLEESDSRDLLDTLDLESLLKQADDPPTETITTTIKSSLKKKSSLYPAPSSNHGIDTFLKLACQEIKALKSTPNDLGNLTVSERTALKNVSMTYHTTIK